MPIVGHNNPNQGGGSTSSIQLQQENARLQAQVTRLGAENATLTADLAKASGDIRKLKKDLDDLQSQPVPVPKGWYWGNIPKKCYDDLSAANKVLFESRLRVVCHRMINQGKWFWHNYDFNRAVFMAFVDEFQLPFVWNEENFYDSDGKYITIVEDTSRLYDERFESVEKHFTHWLDVEIYRDHGTIMRMFEFIRDAMRFLEHQ